MVVDYGRIFKLVYLSLILKLIMLAAGSLLCILKVGDRAQICFFLLIGFGLPSGLILCSPELTLAAALEDSEGVRTHMRSQPQSEGRYRFSIWALGWLQAKWGYSEVFPVVVVPASCWSPVCGP